MALIWNFFITFYQETLFLYNEMAIYLILGFAVGGIIHSFFPQNRIKKSIGARGFLSSLKASLLGVPMPLCSCSVIPTALSLKKSGATRGATVSFLISTPQTGVDSIAATYSLMGPLFAVFRPVVAFITGTLGGFLTDLFDGDEDVDAISEEINRKDSHFRQKLMDAYDYGFNRLLGDIARWIVIGILIGGAITAAVPNHFFEHTSGSIVLSYLGILAFSIPVYVCATGSTPIAAALVLKGMSPGAAFVLLMAGPATNAASITVLFQTIGKKATFLYLAVIIIGSVASGVLFDLFLGKQFIDAFQSMHHHAGDFWSTVKIAGSIVMLIYMVKALIPRRKKETLPMELPDTSKVFRVEGMTCSHCKMAVENAAKGIEGVDSVQVILDEKALILSGDFNEELVIKAVEKMGYTVTASKNH